MSEVRKRKKKTFWYKKELERLRKNYETLQIQKAIYKSLSLKNRLRGNVKKIFKKK